MDKMTTAEMQELYDVKGFMAPLVVVRRKSDGALGTMWFDHYPRLYYGFKPDPDNG